MTSELQPTPSTADEGDSAVDATRGPWLAIGVAVALAGAGGWYALSKRAQPPAPAPADPQTPQAATFSQLEGSVKVKTGGDIRWGDAQLEGDLHESDLVRTGVRSTAGLAFVDDTLVNVRPESLITIQPVADPAGDRRRRASWHVSSGEVNFQRQDDEGSTEVSTPTVRSTISERASANIRVDASGDSDIRLFAGRGHVETTAGDTVDLSENEGLRVDAEGNAGPKLSLPPPPVLRAPADATEVAEAVPPRDGLLLRWSAAPQGAEYRVMVAADASFAEPVVDQREAGEQLLLPRLGRGRHHWRVATISGDGGEGAFSPTRTFDVVAAPPGPALEVARLEVRGNIAQIQGRTLPGSRVTVNGNEVPVQADGSFDEFVTLLGAPGQMVVRSVAPNGGVSQVERPLRER